jgi:glycosyltransferase involved in cell wall biosynthesis
MKVLQLCHKPPFPPKDGGCIAMHNITQGLMREGHQVRILTIFTHKHDLELDQLSDEYIDSTQIEGVFVDTEINIVDAFSSLITQDSYNISRFFSPDFDRRLVQRLQREKFDIIHVESLFMTPYMGTLRRGSKAPIVLRSHNLEYIIWERLAESTSNFAKRLYIKYLAKKLKEYEISMVRQVNGIAAISASDCARYQQITSEKPTIELPFGVDTALYPETFYDAGTPTLFHLGAMDWQPNIEGLDWFIARIWPIVREAHPTVHFHIAGKGLQANDSAFNDPRIVVHGEVDSAIDFMAQHSIMVVPLRAAGGIRVKIIEGMACGKAIVSTRVGAEGLNVENHAEIELADEPESFAAAILALLQHTERITTMGKAARVHALQHFANDVITRRLIDFYNALMTKA